MTTQPRPTAEEEASFLLYSPHPQAAIAAALRKRDELYRLAWEECRTARCAETLLMNGYADPVTLEYTETLALIPMTRSVHDAARRAAGLEDSNARHSHVS